MKLSAEQIERLYRFTREHFVEYYDLQTELVDHLANAIEEQWKENPKLSFEEALQKEFKKFGVFGFMDVVEKRQAALNKKYSKMVWNELKQFFTIPKIIGTLLATGVVFYGIKRFQEEIWMVQSLFAILIVTYFIGMAFVMRQNKRKNKQTGKKWLLKEIIFGYSSSAGLINIPIQFAVHLKGETYPDVLLLLFSFSLILFGLTEYIMLVLIPSKAEDFLKETYPEYEIVQ